MVTDTNRFQFESVTPKTLELASKVYSYVKKPNVKKLYSNLYTRDKKELKFQGYILSKFKTEGKVSYFKVPKKIEKKFNISIESASSFVNITRFIL